MAENETVTPAAAPTTATNQKPVKLVCPKHGDVTTSALYMTFKNGEKVDQFLYCLPCLNEVLLSLQKEGAIQQLQVIVEDPNAAPVTEPAPADAPAEAPKA